MSAAFDRAAIEKPFKVLGRSLKPFSIGHEILLQAGGNAFARTSDSKPEFPDLVSAVRICRQDYNSAIKDVLYKPRRLSFRWWLKALKFIPFDFELEKLKFRAYVEYYRSGPEFTRKADIQRSVSGSPFEYVLKVFLFTEMRFTPEQALNYPYCTAVSDYLTSLEMKGAIHIVDSLEELEREGLRLQQEIIEKCRSF